VWSFFCQDFSQIYNRPFVLKIMPLRRRHAGLLGGLLLAGLYRAVSGLRKRKKRNQNHQKSFKCAAEGTFFRQK
jgi:hypothetical protein